jgi:hypothetical protein
LAFLNTVRTERLDEVLALKAYRSKTGYARIDKMVLDPKAMVGRRLSQEEAKRLLATFK